MQGHGTVDRRCPGTSQRQSRRYDPGQIRTTYRLRCRGCRCSSFSNPRQLAHHVGCGLPPRVRIFGQASLHKVIQQRRFEPPAVDRQLAYTRIAHAEVNALALLPPIRGYEDHRLLTTLEPCCMCLGAAVQSRIISLHYAAPDPYGGSAHLTIDTPQARRRPPVLHGHIHDERGAFAEQLHLAWLLDAAAPVPA